MTTSSPLLEALGRSVRHHRQRASLTLRALATRAHLSPRFLMDVEAGRANISIRRLEDIAVALELQMADLLATPDRARRRGPIALLGLRGAGKTSVGRRLAKRLKVPFLELDTLVADRAGLALGELFSLYGEDYYRRLEREVLRDLLATVQPGVIAVGGGLVTVPETFALLRQGAITVWLRARPSAYWNRVIQQGDQRPMKEHPQARAALEELIARREPLYRQSDLTVDTTRLTVTATVTRLAAALNDARALLPPISPPTPGGW